MTVHIGLASQQRENRKARVRAHVGSVRVHEFDLAPAQCIAFVEVRLPEANDAGHAS